MSDRELINLLAKLRKSASSRELDLPYNNWYFTKENSLLLADSFDEIIKHPTLSAQIENDNDGKKLSLNLSGVDNWFVNIDDYFRKLRLKTKKDEDIQQFFIIEDIEDEIYKYSYEELFIKSKTYNIWCQLLTKLANHTEYDRASSWPSYIFISENAKNKTISTYQITLKDSGDGILLNLSSPPCELETLTNGDIHAYERRLVMRSSLLELYNESQDKSNLLAEVICQPDAFWETFSANYEVYISKFSLDKVIYEVESQKLDFLDKLNKLIQEHQAKSLTIPAVLISTAIIKGWTPSALILIFMAMLITCVIVLLGIHTAKEALKDIAESADRVLTSLRKDSQDPISEEKNIRVRKIINDANHKIKNKKESADEILFYIELCVFLGMVIWASFVIYQFKGNIVDFFVNLF